MFPPSAPVFYFGEVDYHVDESDGHVVVKVWRMGTDLSKTATVTVRSRKADTASAEGNTAAGLGMTLLVFIVMFFLSA
jgi:hypothetical protein